MSPKKKDAKKVLKPASTSRPHYFEGEMLEAENLEAEQQYHRPKRHTTKKKKKPGRK